MKLHARRLLSPLRQLVAAALSALAVACAASAGVEAARPTFYISPAGSDANDGRSEQRPFRSFAHAFRAVPPGGRLLLLDGSYSEAAGTGAIRADGRGSGQPASGTDAGRLTEVAALHPGNVVVVGSLVVGTKTRQDSYVLFTGITFEGGGHLYNTRHVTVRNCGFHGGFAIGTNDHHDGNTRDLVEDVWIWASGERVIAINYRSHENVWRRVIVRGDGCGTPECHGSGNPNFGISVYDSRDVSLQNVVVLDRVLAPGDEPYADFGVAQHTADPRYHLGRCSWLGTLSLKSPDDGYYLEADETIDPTYRLADAVAWDSRYDGFSIARAGTGIALENLTVRSLEGDAVRIAPEMKSGVLRNVLVAGAGRRGLNSAFQPSYVNVFGTQDDAYRQTRCQVGCHAVDPRGALRFLTRIEAGSYLKGRGEGGRDIGANLVHRWGAEGSRFGEEGWDRLTQAPLWPWPNEERIRREMCERSGVARGFCAAPSLTRYVWEYLGHPLPPELSAAEPQGPVR